MNVSLNITKSSWGRNIIIFQRLVGVVISQTINLRSIVYLPTFA